MDAESLNNIAKSLAVYAVTGDRSGLEKQADVGQFLSDAYAKAQPYLADPYIRNSLMGLGAGGLVGLAQPKRKLRNALTYGLLGGLGGLGATHLFNGGKVPESAPADGGPANPPAAVGADGKPITPERAAEIEQMDKSYDPNVGRAIGKATAGVGGAAAGYRVGVGAMKRREGLQNLLDVQTNAQNAGQRATADTLAASRAARAARDTLGEAGQRGAPTNASRAFVRNATNAAVSELPGLAGTAERLRGAQNLAHDAGRAVNPSAFRLSGPNASARSAIAGAARAANPASTVTPQSMSAAISEANRLAPTRLRHRIGGGLLGAGVGMAAQGAGGWLGETFVNNFMNKPPATPPAPPAAR